MHRAGKHVDAAVFAGFAWPLEERGPSCMISLHGFDEFTIQYRAFFIAAYRRVGPVMTNLFAGNVTVIGFRQTRQIGASDCR